MIPAAPVTNMDVQRMFGVHVAVVSMQYRVHEIPTPVSVPVSVMVTSTFPVMLVALSVVVGAILS